MVQRSGETGHSHEEEETGELTDEKLKDAQEVKEGIESDVDDILDEIDDVLEANAEDFVKAFIQKGGQ